MRNDALINGRAEGGVSVRDRGLAYGDGVFRTFPVYGGYPHCWQRHYQRLCDDCNGLAIVCPPADILLAEIQRLCGAEAQAVIKIIITRGESNRGYALPPLAQPTRILLKAPLPQWPASHFSEGVTLHLCETRLARQPRLAGIKHLNRLENVLARMEWMDPQIADGLLLDGENHVIEGTMSNLFMRVGKALVTPDLSLCGVRGVTRDRVLALAPGLGCRPEVRDITLDELLQAEEVLICNSLFGAWQARQLAETTWPAGRLASRLSSLLREDETSVA